MGQPRYFRFVEMGKQQWCNRLYWAATFAGEIAKLKIVGAQHLTLAAPLLNCKAGTVVMVTAAAKLFARFRAQRAPTLSIKTDRAEEFADKRFQEWTAPGTRPPPIEEQNSK